MSDRNDGGQAAETPMRKIKRKFTELAHRTERRVRSMSFPRNGLPKHRKPTFSTTMTVGSPDDKKKPSTSPTTTTNTSSSPLNPSPGSQHHHSERTNVSAISILPPTTDSNSPDGKSSRGDSDNDSLDMESSGPLEFPIDELTNLDQQASLLTWCVQVTDDSPLSHCLKAAIRLTNAGMDQADPACKRFMESSLGLCFEKILIDDAVCSWTPVVHNCIFVITRLVIKLAVLKIKKIDSIGPLDVLAMSLNPEIRIHGTAPARRYKPQLHSVFVQHRPSTGFLAACIHEFGDAGGFDFLRDQIMNADLLALTGPVLTALIKPFGFCYEHLAPFVIQETFVPIAEKICRFVEENECKRKQAELEKEKKKTTSKNEIKSEDLGHIFRWIQAILRCANDTDYLVDQFQTFRFNLISRMLKQGLFSEKMNALKEINRLIGNVNYPNRLISSGLTSLYQHEPNSNELISAEELCKWIKDNDLMHTSLQDCLHHTQYVERLETFLHFLIKCDCLTSCDLEMIWNAQKGKHEAIEKNIHELLAKIAQYLSVEQLDFLFKCFQTNWVGAPPSQRTKVLVLIQRLAEEDSRGELANKILTLLWQMVQCEDLSAEMVERALLTFNSVFQRLPGKSETKYGRIISSNVDNNTNNQPNNGMGWIRLFISQLAGEKCVILALKQLRNLAGIFLELQNTSFGDVDFGVDSKGNSFINRIHKEHNLIELVINDLAMYMSKAKQLCRADTEVTESNLHVEKRFSHDFQITERLDFIRFVLSQRNALPLEITYADQIWHILAKEAIFPSDRDRCFSFFEMIIPKEFATDQSTCTEFLRNNLLKLDPELYTEKGLRCFDKLLRTIYPFSRYILPDSVDQVDNGEEFEGRNFLWQIVLRAKPEAAQCATEIFKSIYASVSDIPIDRLKSVHCKFLSECMQALKSTDDQTTQSRVLSLMHDYISNCDTMFAKERTKLPLHRSWRGYCMTVEIQSTSYHHPPHLIIAFKTHSNDVIGSVRRKVMEKLAERRYRTAYNISDAANADLKYRDSIIGVNDDSKRLCELDMGDHHLIFVCGTRTGWISNNNKMKNDNVDVSSSPETNSDGFSDHDDSNIDEMDIVTSSVEEDALPSVILSRSEMLDQVISYCELHRKDDTMNLHDEACNILRILPPGKRISEIINDALMDCDEHEQLKPLTDLLLTDNVTLSLYSYQVLLSLLLPAKGDDNCNVHCLRHFMFHGGPEWLFEILLNGGLISDSGQAILHGKMEITLLLIELVLTILAISDNSSLAILRAFDNRFWNDIYFMHIFQRVIDSGGFTTVNSSQDSRKETLSRLIGRGHIESLREIIDITCQDCSPSCAESLKLCQRLVDLLFILLSLSSSTRIHDLLDDPQWCALFTKLLYSNSSIDVRDAAESGMLRSCQLYLEQFQDRVLIVKVTTLCFDIIKEHSKTMENDSEQLFSLICKLLKQCCDRGLIPDGVSEMIDFEIEWLLNVREHWLSSNGVSIGTGEAILNGHLMLLTNLMPFKSPAELQMIGTASDGRQLIKTLMRDFLFAAAYHMRNETIIQESICAGSYVLTSAFRLLCSLVRGCSQNLKYVLQQLSKLFYSKKKMGYSLGYGMTTSLDQTMLGSVVNSRPPLGFVGLKNASATCYMNAVLQQLFMLRPMREVILRVNLPEKRGLSDEKFYEKSDFDYPSTSVYGPSSLKTNTPIIGVDDDSSFYNIDVFKQLQLMFGHLLSSNVQYYIPSGFWNTFRLYGEPVNIREQHDSVEFLQNLVDSIDEAFKACGYPPFWTQIVGGIFADQKICRDCPHRYTRDENFIFLSVNVQHAKCLQESLEQYVRGELLEGANAYLCEQCNKKVATVKKTYIKECPDILIIQLKRFDYDWERDVAVKYDDFFEFPRELDMGPYMLKEENDVNGIDSSDASISPDDCSSSADCEKKSDEYRLVGVVVHSGQANGGHYYSLIYNTNEFGKTGRWYKFDDVDVKESEMDYDSEFHDLCFGGDYVGDYMDFHLRSSFPRHRQKWWSAYILIYERSDYLNTKTYPDALSAVMKSKDSREANRNLASSRLSFNARMPVWVENIVKKHNIHHLFDREQSCCEYVDFIRSLVRTNEHAGVKLKPTNAKSTSYQLSEDEEAICEYSVMIGHNFLMNINLAKRKQSVNIVVDILKTFACYSRKSRIVRQYLAEQLLLVRKYIMAFLIGCESGEVAEAFSKLMLTNLDTISGEESTNSDTKSDLTMKSTDETDYILTVNSLDVQILNHLIVCAKDAYNQCSKRNARLFNVLYEYASIDDWYRRRLIELEVPLKFLQISLSEPDDCYLGYRTVIPTVSNQTVGFDSPCIVLPYVDIQYFHHLLLMLLRCYDLSVCQSNQLQSDSFDKENEIGSLQTENTLKNPYRHGEHPLCPMDLGVYHLASSDQFLSVILNEDVCALEECQAFLQFVCWENMAYSQIALGVTMKRKYLQDLERTQASYNAISAMLNIVDSQQESRCEKVLNGFQLDNMNIDGLKCYIATRRGTVNSRDVMTTRLLYKCVQIISPQKLDRLLNESDFLTTLDLLLKSLNIKLQQEEDICRNIDSSGSSKNRFFMGSLTETNAMLDHLGSFAIGSKVSGSRRCNLPIIHTREDNVTSIIIEDNTPRLTSPILKAPGSLVSSASSISPSGSVASVSIPCTVVDSKPITTSPPCTLSQQSMCTSSTSSAGGISCVHRTHPQAKTVVGSLEQRSSLLTSSYDKPISIGRDDPTRPTVTHLHNQQQQQQQQQGTEDKLPVKNRKLDDEDDDNYDMV